MVRMLFAAWMLVLLAGSAQAKLGIDKIQSAYGPLGPERKSLDIYPYDDLFFRFTVTGAKADAEGRVDVTVMRQVLDTMGKKLAEDQYPAKSALVLGGDSFPLWVILPMGEQVTPGKYTVKITVRDNVSGESASFQRPVTVKAAEFKIVDWQFFRDPDGKIPAPAGGALGETLFFRLRIIGFDRGKDRIFTEVVLKTLDSDGAEISPKRIVDDIRQDDAKSVRSVGFLKYSNSLMLTRVGKFTLRIVVNDRLSKKSTKFEVPIQVTAP